MSPDLAVMSSSLPSPNGSTSSSNFSSEDSNSISMSLQNCFSKRVEPSHLNYQFPVNILIQSQVTNKPMKICGACGDRAKSYHFGGISCDSCKAFFRRSVQNNAYKNFHCPYEGQCDINIMSRKCCQYCRFQKCLLIGMEKSWVMTEEERLQMLKSRLEKKKMEKMTLLNKCKLKGIKRFGRIKDEYEPDINIVHNYLSEEDINLLEDFINRYFHCCQLISFQQYLQKPDLSVNRIEIINLLFTAIQQFASFAQHFKSFRKLSSQDQYILLSGSVLELCFLRGAFIFDLKSSSWPLVNQPISFSGSFMSSLAAKQVRPLLGEELFNKHMNFVRIVKDIDIDECTLMLIVVVILLCPDRYGLKDTHMIALEQERYLILMRNYMNWRYGESSTNLLYPKLLLILPELRELAEAHNEFNLFLCKSEIDQVKQRLINIQINFDKWSSEKNVIISNIYWSFRENAFGYKKRRNSETSFCLEQELFISSEGSGRLIGL